MNIATHPLHRVLQGVFVMCRQNQLLGIVLMAFGLGLLFGLWIEAGFIAYCICGGLVFLGCVSLKKR